MQKVKESFSNSLYINVHPLPWHIQGLESQHVCVSVKFKISGSMTNKHHPLLQLGE